MLLQYKNLIPKLLLLFLLAAFLSGKRIEPPRAQRHFFVATLNKNNPNSCELSLKKRKNVWYTIQDLEEHYPACEKEPHPQYIFKLYLYGYALKDSQAHLSLELWRKAAALAKKCIPECNELQKELALSINDTLNLSANPYKNQNAATDRD